MKKIFSWFVVIAILGGAISAFWWWRDRQATLQPVAEILRMAEVTRGDLEITVAASGNLAVNDKVNVFFRRAGTVAIVAVAENERVKAGQVLARLDTAELERAVQNAEIAVEQAQLNLTILTRPADATDLELARLTAQSAAQTLEALRLGKITAKADADALIVDAQRARENAFKDYQSVQDKGGDVGKAYAKYENLVEQERIARINANLIVKQADDQWLAAYYRYQQAQYALKKQEQGPNATQLAQAELQVTQAELNLEQARRNLADAVLIAPGDGLVSAVNVQAGVSAPLQGAAVVLIDDSAFFVDVMVDEMDIGRMALGQVATITLDAYAGTPLRGQVENLAPAPTNVGGIISYRARVRITDTAGVAVRDGMTANVVVAASRRPAVILVPNWAIRTDLREGVIYCYRLENGAPVRVVVLLGERSDTHTEVLAGLEPGDVVALVTEERTLFSDLERP
ncbi:MAG TPA: efflux RND transporter periplasmic adaptor subunit [Anaerolineae bacterium]|nr:efflux RND transporter periplasmic adaptor subunit [Anaerolineae bacterium]